jgi:hypothetical protein
MQLAAREPIAHWLGFGLWGMRQKRFGKGDATIQFAVVLFGHKVPCQFRTAAIGETTVSIMPDGTEFVIGNFPQHHFQFIPLLHGAGFLSVGLRPSPASDASTIDPAIRSVLETTLHCGSQAVCRHRTIGEMAELNHQRDVLGTRAFLTPAFRKGDLLAFMQSVVTYTLEA